VDDNGRERENGNGKITLARPNISKITERKKEDG
jgi:hypothetical protein